MAPSVEASSLSDITHLASNPPKYPRNPTEKKRKPLTLYIARVPGSRDVILTTLKPQLKNITATDIAASLYYLHLNTEEDDKLIQEAEALTLEDDRFNEVVQKPLSRKPLPESAKSSIDLPRKPVATPEPLSNSNPNNKISRKAIASDQKATPEIDVDNKEEIHGRPLGPRPLLSEAFSSRKPLSGTVNRPSSSGSHIHKPLNPCEDPRDVSKLEEFPSSTKSSNKTFSVTIIRRDPSSAGQWNIGTFDGQELSQKVRPTQSKKPYYDISVNITTSGYSQFRDHPASNDTGSQISPADDPPGTLQSGFNRRICMQGSSFWDRSKQHKRVHSDVPDHNATRGRSESTDSPSTAFLTSRSNEAHESKTKGYVFSSPWGGRCKFFTSGSGRSLRCNHTITNPVSTSSTTDDRSSSQGATVSELRFNLPSSAMFQSPVSPNSTTGGRPGRSEDLGRFHIPKLEQIRNKLSPDKSKPTLPPRPRLGPPPGSYAAMYPSDDDDPPSLPPRPYSYSHVVSSDDDREHSHQPSRLHPAQLPQHTARWTSEEDEDLHLDLSLGQEKAGGGNKGKRVKLGKLIVYDEGCKMMDLIVAANMGIWWSVWESNNSST